MRAKLKIIRYRKRWPLKPSSEIAKLVGVSPEYVHKILKNAELPTSAPRQLKYRYSCKQCNVMLRWTPGKNGSKLFCSESCRYNYRHVPVKCSFCQVSFRRPRYRLTDGIKLGYNRIYCSQRCQHKGRQEVNSKYGN